MAIGWFHDERAAWRRQTSVRISATVVLAVLLAALTGCSSSPAREHLRDSGVGADADADAAAPPLTDANADTTCAAIDIPTRRALPNVVVIIDQSGSMGMVDFPYGSGTPRWDALRESLMADPSGLVYSLQSSVRWGMAWFHGGVGCPSNLTTVHCALNNYESLLETYTSLSPEGTTPTGESIEELLTRLPSVIDRPDEPTIFILATDGDPNLCADNEAWDAGQSSTVDAVAHAYDMGIGTYVVSISDAPDRSKLQAVADAGRGGSGGTVWVATDPVTLSEALSSILTSIEHEVVSCDVELMGAIDPTNACRGRVRLAGVELACGDPNGWHASDATHITLDGEACTMLLAGVVPLEATFPCEVVVF